MFNLKQDYDSYTREDRLVWKTLYERQMVNFKNRASQAFLDGLEKVCFSKDKIANFDETNAILNTETGWSLEVVGGLIPDKVFFELLSQKKFPASTWLRKMSQIDYLEEPDMFHDVFAHVPLLSNLHFVDFLKKLSEIALKHIDNPLAIELLGRLYWFTIEFGLVQEVNGIRIYGAGILSSAEETVYCLSDKPKHLPYDIKSIMAQHYYKDACQDRYYIIESFEQLYNSREDIETCLNLALAKYPSVDSEVSKLDLVLA